MDINTTTFAQAVDKAQQAYERMRQDFSWSTKAKRNLRGIADCVKRALEAKGFCYIHEHNISSDFFAGEWNVRMDEECLLSCAGYIAYVTESRSFYVALDKHFYFTNQGGTMDIKSPLERTFKRIQLEERDDTGL